MKTFIVGILFISAVTYVVNFLLKDYMAWNHNNRDNTEE